MTTPIERELKLAGYNGIAAQHLADEWVNHHYSDKRAIAWIRVGVCDPCDAMDEEDMGYSPADYQD
jgi:hypothetical protein